MTTGAEHLPAAVLKRKAVVYIRQSTQSQVQTNLESRRRQYDLVDLARTKGFVDVELIDDDLGRSGSSTVARPGFDRLVATLCAGQVGAVLCMDASRLARNGRDWHHLLELCGLVQARVIDLDAAWNAPAVTTRARQQLMRTLIIDIVADVDDATREVIVTIHWRGGQHSQIRVRKPRTGEHGCTTSDQAIALIQSMAGRWSDEDIAASLNRIGIRTGQGKTWTAHRVGSLRRVRGISAYRSAYKEQRVVDDERSRIDPWRHESRDPQTHQGPSPACRAGRRRRAVPDPLRGSRRPCGYRCRRP